MVVKSALLHEIARIDKFDLIRVTWLTQHSAAKPASYLAKKFVEHTAVSNISSGIRSQ